MMKSGEDFSVVTPMRCTSGGKPRQRLGDAVLHLHLRVVEIACRARR